MTVPAGQAMTRRSCTCGEGFTVAGTDLEANARLLARWDTAHSGPGHGPSGRTLAQEGRTEQAPQGRRKAAGT